VFFVGIYSATLYRLDFSEFHPETVLGFLPHDLDFTHLSMLWRRWQEKSAYQCLWYFISVDSLQIAKLTNRNSLHRGIGAADKDFPCDFLKVCFRQLS